LVRPHSKGIKIVAGNPVAEGEIEQLRRARKLLESGRLAEAESSYRSILVANPRSGESLHMLGIIAIHRGQFENAIELITGAVEVDPADAQACNSLGFALERSGKTHSAVEIYRRACGLSPSNSLFLSNLGNALQASGELQESAFVCRKAIEADPNYAPAYNNLGMGLVGLGQYDEAAEAFRNATRINPNLAEAYVNRANALRQIGQIDEAVNAYREAMRLQPGNAAIHGALVFALCFHPNCSAAAILAEARRWDQFHARSARKFIQPHRNVRDPDRRLKIGYVSGDLRAHAVGFALLPWFPFHDRAGFEIFCYSNNAQAADEVSQKLRGYSDHWLDIAPISDGELADRIRVDEIDILVDLSLHTAGNRLISFAMEPAPVQITYLGYCSTTGVEAMHYRFSDPFIDPPGQDSSIYSEKTIRLPRTYWCYQPRYDMPDVSSLPSEANGYITFGCLNQFAKVSSAALESWRQILLKVPRSRLLLHAPAGRHLDAVMADFAREGISTERIEFVPRQSWDQYLRMLARIDIGLDPFPYNGGITTCDTLMMGVPVVALRGETSTGRGGRSILANVGLPDLVGDSPQEYVRIATDLAASTHHLAELRCTLRERMKSSPLMNGRQFARDIEAAYRAVWQDWCASAGQNPH
jgi:predicted O-linked N-acetylglucosamine transferase (SPINDLY family)